MTDTNERLNEKQPAVGAAAVASLIAHEKPEHPDSITARPGAQGPNVDSVDSTTRWRQLQEMIRHLDTLGYHIINLGVSGGLCCVQARAGRSTIDEFRRPADQFIQAVEQAVVACQQDAQRRRGVDKAA